MEDFDIFTNEIDFAKPVHKNILHKYVNEVPSTPSGPNYESGRKLLGQECLAEGQEIECAFNFTESASATLRTLAVYRDEQLKIAGNKLSKITDYIKPIKNIVERNPISKEDKQLLDILPNYEEEVTEMLSKYAIDEELPFYKKYMRFGSDNNVNNFMKIIKELPKEWTIIQLTTPYNPNENLKPFSDYRSEISSLYITLLSNKYFDAPVTVEVPANITKEGEKPLFEELYSLLDENYRTIDNAQFLNNKRLVQNYWTKREDIDLRMKSVINVMYKEWLGGWSSLLTGQLVDDDLREKVIKHVETAVSDWGFIRLTSKQKRLLYNLIECSPVLSSEQLKSCIRKILTEHGNIEDIKKVFKAHCGTCTEFKYINELCLKCLSKCFESIHNFTLVDGIKAFSQVATQVKDGDEWAGLKKAKRHPVILIVDEMLDTFPWETLPILYQHPVSRIENIHFLYALYKIHEKNIVDGYYTVKTDVGRYIINPEKNLERMEQRMSSFVKFWCESWSGTIGELPTADDYLSYLSESDVFLNRVHGKTRWTPPLLQSIRNVGYCGHGDGLHLASTSSHIEAAAAHCLTVLSGCGSLRLTRGPARTPPAAAHHHLHVAGCPIVIGMLWEVTDLEVDKVVTTMLSLFVPSRAACDWKTVGKGKWSQGVIEVPPEPRAPPPAGCSVLDAVSRARTASSFIMISSSLVVRGLPGKVP